MITDIEPFFVSPSSSSTGAATHPRTPRHPSSNRLSALIHSRAEREEAFERAHGSYWEPGLLDRLTSPLTRYHE